MIGYLHGKLRYKRPPFLLLDVNGVGYELEAPMTTFYALPEEQAEIGLHVHLLVREDAQLLFGFSDQAQRRLFRSLLKLNGVGPRVALAILSTFTAAEFVACVHRKDAEMLTRVPGIGAKTAGRMLFDMRDRLVDLDAGDAATPGSAADMPVQDAIGALVALGYAAAEATRAVRAVGAESTLRDDLIRNALQYLSNR